MEKAQRNLSQLAQLCSWFNRNLNLHLSFLMLASDFAALTGESKNGAVTDGAGGEQESWT